MSNENSSTPNQSSPGDDKTFTSVEAVVAHYVAAWRAGLAPDMDDFLPSPDQPHRRVLLEKLVAADLTERLRAGEAARLEDYIGRFPELGEADDLPFELIVAEYHARRNRGEAVGLQEYARRFPARIARLGSEFSTHAYEHNAEDEQAVSLDLDPGTVLGDFQIECLLGAGGYSRVYLARQQSLERRVVLKVSRALGEEGKALAQLDHPNIASVFSEQTVEGRKLLAMRYVPGKTLADWMAHRAQSNTTSWRGSDLLDWLDRETAGLPGGKDTGGRDVDGREEFAALSFAPAVCRMILGLARGLQHSHSQGVMHRDIKPANILIDLTGRALLMDFNVAARCTGGSDPEAASLGGTLAYMSPEHLAALQADVVGTAAEVDQRADIYSLGIVFFELLAGRHPWPYGEASPTPAAIRQLTALRLQGSPQLPPRLPGVSPGLRSIVEKCLAPLPQDRYQSAGDLAEDLQRLLEHRPLAVAGDPSRRERLFKCARRHPRALSVAATVVVLLLALAVYGGWRDLRRLNLAEGLLAETAAASDAGHSQAAADNLLDAQNTLVQPNFILPESFTAARRNALDEQMSALAARVARSELRRFEQLADARRGSAPGRAKAKGAVDLTADPLEIYRVLDSNDWQQLPYYRSLEPSDRVRVDEDITELLLARAVAPTKDGKTDASKMLDLLDRVPAIHREQPPVELLRRQSRQQQSGRAQTAGLLTAAADEFDHYLTGVIAAQRGEYATAVECLETALKLRPEDKPPRFWARFLHAYCCQQSGRDDEAIADYGICIGLRPDFAWPYNNLGLIYTKRGRYALAIKNFLEAARLQPQSPEAYANLGVAEFQLGRFADSRRSFDRAIDLGSQTAEVYSNRAAAREALGDVRGARKDLERALDIDPESQPARQNLEHLDGRLNPGQGSTGVDR